MHPAIELNQVSKIINKKKIINDISLSVFPGEVFGLLGPNGAGKTTTIRMIVGLMKTTSGSIYINGQNLASNFEKALSNVGAVVENPELYSFLSGWHNLKHYQRMAPGVTNERLAEVIQLVGLNERIHDKVKTYSLGMRQRLGLAQALLHQPKVLILDEPTNGLDPAGIREIRDYLRQLAEKENICVIVSSHLLSEMEKMCDRIAVIQKGEIIRVEKVADFVQHNKNEWFLEVTPAKKALAVARTITSNVSAEESGITVKLDKQQIPLLVSKLVAAQISVFMIRPAKQNTLEDQFLSITGGENVETV
ncbi:ABC-2 type transport system ATP-binding protein [Evansella caseinilytica]|uniref:ABC-2 type transport system ATP-binding protein n=1 Tax=Evansella caseinilytica TaxID=1503961 RepID=A0A1H3HLL7_9BACI|nr:ABC transporter ATP-binding protein [Evansella caseinilytica]SDY16391.1 ABC-2 type transport system ATP-binding protein [Evansella caseinilytica]